MALNAATTLIESGHSWLAARLNIEYSEVSDMVKIKTSQLTEKQAAVKAQKVDIKEAIPEEVKLVNIDFKVFEVHLENNDGIFIIDLDKTKNYKIKNGYLYKGLFKKIGKIKFIRIKR